MNIRTLLVIAAVIAFVFAIGLLIAPGFMGTTYGMAPTPANDLMGRYYGTTLLTLAVVLWMSKDLPAANLGPIITASFIGNAVGFIVSLLGTLGGVMNATGWSAVVIYLLLALGFAYFQFMPPSK
jgi:hypothetical protein